MDKKATYEMKSIGVLFILIFLLSSCVGGQAVKELYININIDGSTSHVTVRPGTTVREALSEFEIDINPLDRTSPPMYTVLEGGDTISVVRVVEEYVVERSIVPYTTQVLKNESLQEGERKLIQPGSNGIIETTYRILYEDGIEISRTISDTQLIQAAVSEIIMIGSQTPYSVIPIPGILAYISAGNAWIMRENTGVRIPVVTTGDLDGRVFAISPDGRWLLYTRSADSPDVVNTLWVARIDSEDELIFNLGVQNIIHFADWVPGVANGIVYSTAEASPSPPGWQANNDLVFMNFSEETGWTSSPRISIEPNLGGVYGWWGTNYQYSPNGEKMVFSRPDGFGAVNPELNIIQPYLNIIPVQTRSDWAWISPLSWSPDSNYIYFVDHVVEDALAAAEDSADFDLKAFPINGGAPVTLAEDVGMFAVSAASPIRHLPGEDNSFSVAFLKAANPAQSRSSEYQLMLMDRDGSNLDRIFPQGTGQGLAPQRFYWIPWYGVDDYPMLLALIYQGNLWILDTDTREAFQMTGDGLIASIDWN